MDNKKDELSLTTPVTDLEQRLLEEDNVDNMKNIVELFNLNIQKKNIIRINKLNTLQDKVYNQIEQRIEKHPDNFSNKDLLDYFKTIQDTISKSDVSTENIKQPTIQINQQNNINIQDRLSSESKRKVRDAVKSIIDKYKELNIEEENISDDYT